MTDEAESILSAALKLPESERFYVLEGLLRSLPAPGLWDMDDPKFGEEVERRSKDATRGVPWEDVRRSLGRPRK